jgi:hypothetical protein
MIIKHSRITSAAFAVILIVTIVFMSGREAAGAREDPARQFPHQPYFGETPPDATPKRFAPEIVRLDGAIHGSIAFSPDGSEIYWTLFPPSADDGPPKLMYVKEVGGKWLSPQVAPFCDEYGATEISISPDGRRLYYGSRRPWPDEGRRQPRPGSREWAVGKIWFVERTGSGWGEPQILEDRINVELNGVSSTLDGTLYASGIRRIRRMGDAYGAIERLAPPARSDQDRRAVPWRTSIHRPGRELPAL